MSCAPLRPFLLALVIGTLALAFLAERGISYVHIDAIAHVNKARTLVDNLEPGIVQHGSVWLPLPHLLVLPLVWNDTLWKTGLAGSIPNVVFFAATAACLFCTTLLLLNDRRAAWLAWALFTLNPRLVYLHATPMTEPLMILALAASMLFLVEWSQSGNWAAVGGIALALFIGTWTRYEGWVFALALVLLMGAYGHTLAALLAAGGAAVGPLVWMIYNSIYFEDPLYFVWGRGSAVEFALNHFLQTGRSWPSAGSWEASLHAYFAAASYSATNPVFVWGLAGACLLAMRSRMRSSSGLAAAALVLTTALPLVFYTANLYFNRIPVQLPGLSALEPDNIYNVRYGAVAAAALPVGAAVFVFSVIGWLGKTRGLLVVVLTAALLPSPVPARASEPFEQMLTGNLMFRESERNQSFWMPPFVDIARTLREDMERYPDGLVLSDSRHIHPIVWATGTPMRHFLHELHRDRWLKSLNAIDPEVRWVLVEEGDQMWNAHAGELQSRWDEVRRVQGIVTRPVHLYRRR